MKRTTTVRKAILVGSVWVNGPIIPIMVAPLFTYSYFTRGEPSWNEAITIFGLIMLIATLIVGFVFSWLWWSFNIPKWREWAYSRVHDREKLIKRAVESGLIWPSGHVFEKTEFSKSDAEKIDEKP